MVFSPSAECFSLTFFGPVNYCIPQDPALSVPVMCFVNPCVETTSGLHVNSPGNEISHHFLCKTLHLCYDMMLRVISVCKVILVFCYWLRMFILASLQLLDVVLKKLLGILSDHLLPLHKCCTTNVAFDTMTCAVKEFFSQLELSDESEPRKPNILLCHVLPLISEPVTFLVDKFHSPNCFGLTEPFFETKPCSVA